jgi:2-C-methyl-D-erythritol 4-phosphate cytidylyltransferase
MVEWSIAAFRQAAGVRSIVVACPPGHVHDLGGRDLGVVDGGETRAASVANALAAVGTELVAIHDAARPFVSAELIEGVIATLAADPEADGAIAAVPVSDTIKRLAGDAAGDLSGSAVGDLAGGGVDDEAAMGRPASKRAQFPTEEVEKRALVIGETVDRGDLWAAQTPQVFRTASLRRALEAEPLAAASVTDEAMLIEAAGGRVLIHQSTPENMKVTTPFDLELAGVLAAERDG